MTDRKSLNFSLLGYISYLYNLLTKKALYYLSAKSEFITITQVLSRENDFEQNDLILGDLYE